METAQTIAKKLQIISEESAQNAFVNQEPSRFLISLFDTFWLQDPLALALVCHKFLAKISDISAHFSPEGKNIS
jgi:hypothetical protein